MSYFLEHASSPSSNVCPPLSPLLSVRFVHRHFHSAMVSILWYLKLYCLIHDICNHCTDIRDYCSEHMHPVDCFLQCKLPLQPSLISDSQVSFLISVPLVATSDLEVHVHLMCDLCKYLEALINNHPLWRNMECFL